MKTIELKTARVSLREDGIMHIHIKAGEEMHLDDAKRIVKAMGKLGNKKKFPVLIDCDEFSSVDKDLGCMRKAKMEIFIHQPMRWLTTLWRINF